MIMIFITKTLAHVQHSVYQALLSLAQFNKLLEGPGNGATLQECSWSRQPFRKNYSFILQDAAQDFHWNNSQATLYPIIVYYLNSGEFRNHDVAHMVYIHHVSYVKISDCLHYDIVHVAVHLFQ